jgi:HD-like signal output (HDOD) protein
MYLKDFFMDRSEALNYIIEQTLRGDLVFPTNVNASLQIHQALDEPDCCMESAANLVVTEPLLAARLVAIANSVAYNRFGGGVTNVKTAISILGFSTLRAIVMSIAIRQLGHSIKNPQLRRKASQLWEHSAHVAALAFIIAKKISHVDFEAALFIGIVHEVGGFYVLSRAEEFPVLLENWPENSPEPDHSADSAHLAKIPEAIIGRAVLQKLMLPKTVISSVETLWSGTRTTSPETLGDTLMLANDLVTVISPFDVASSELIEERRLSIDFKLGDSTLKKVLSTSEEEIHSLTEALMK